MIFGFDFMKNGFIKPYFEDGDDIGEETYQLEDSFIFNDEEVIAYVHLLNGEIDNVELDLGEIKNEDDILNSNIADEFLIYLQGKTGLKLERKGDVLITVPAEGLLEFSVIQAQ